MSQPSFEEGVKKVIREYTWAAAFFKEMVQELGKEKARDIAFTALCKLRVEAAHDLAKRLGGTFEAFCQPKREAAEKSEAVTIVEESKNHITVRVGECAAWEAANRLGAPDMCRALCDTDPMFSQAYNPRMRYEAKLRKSDGDDVCEGTWRWEE